jgi:flagellar basal-body rod protein FlgG
MMRSLNIGGTGMLAQQTNVEVISNNIANVNTNAYTKRRAEFQDLLYQNLRRAGLDSSDSGTVVPTGIQLGLGVKTAAIYRITEHGSLNNTGGELDIAVQGNGYFEIELPDGSSAYTRDGAFQRDDSGQLVTHDGYKVMPGISIPSDTIDISINSSGEVYIQQDGQNTLTNVGQLQLAIFANDSGLEAKGNNLFIETAASGAATLGTPGSTGYGTILQNYLETSNVNIVSEITDLISAQRAYEMNSKVIKASDEMLATISQIK